MPHAFTRFGERREPAIRLVAGVILLAGLCGCGKRGALTLGTQLSAPSTAPTAEMVRAKDALLDAGANGVEFNYATHDPDKYGIDTGLTEVYMLQVKDINSVLKNVRDHLQALPRLKLHMDGIDDSGLEQLSNLTNLVWLDLRDSEVSDAGVAHLANLTNLHVLNIESKHVTNAGYPHLARLSRLAILQYGKSVQVNDDALAHYKHFSNLRSLRIQNDIGLPPTDAGLETLKSLPELRELHIRSAVITDAGLANLTGLTRLKELHLAECIDVTDAGFDHIKGLTSLEKLDLEDSKCTDAVIPHLRKFTRLCELGLRSTEVTDAALPGLVDMRNLKYVNFRKTKMTARAVADFRKARPDVELGRK